MTLSELRKQKGLSQKEFAALLNTKQSIISRYENGAVKPSLERIQEMANILGVDVRDIDFNDYSIKEFFNSVVNNNANSEAQLKLKSLEDRIEKLETTNTSILKRIVLLGSNGCCELCGKKAPFTTKEGQPYLEIHRIDLNFDGQDQVKNMVALCPNCHKKIHNLCDSDDISIIKEKASSHNY